MNFFRIASRLAARPFPAMGDAEVECNADLDHPCDADRDEDGEPIPCPSCRAHMEEMMREFKNMRPDQLDDLRAQADPEYAHSRQEEQNQELEDAGRGHLVRR